MGVSSITRSFSNTPLDKELQLSYEGIAPRLFTLKDNLMQVEGQDKFLKWIGDGVIGGGGVLKSFMVFSDFHNPLLLKYDFDPEVFLVGAKKAIEQVHLSLGSRDLWSYSNNIVAESPAAVLLEAAFDERLYSECLKASRQCSANIFIRDIDILTTSISAATTKVIDKDEEGEKGGTCPYNPNSVVARVDVYYEAEEVHFNYTTETELSRPTSSKWTFEGCISGHSDLDWKIVSFA